MDAAGALAQSAALVAALARRLDARLIETHISWVLLAGDEALKSKTPVRLPFLDFSTLEARRQMCSEELRLNRRLAPQLYREVVPITGSVADPRPGGEGAAIEYALRMRRFADGALLSERLAAGTLQAAAIDHLASHLAAFHRDAAVAAPDSPWGTAERVAADLRGVLDGLAARAPAFDAASWRAWADTEVARLRPVWAERHRAGWVREGHGDLHLANVVVEGDEAVPFDCIEFDPGLRWIDVQADIGFLVMDLLAHERAELAFRFLDRYLADGGDYGGLAVLRFYLVYRALVRALVASLRAPGHAPAAAAYLALAERLREPPGARLLVTHGLSGSGKSRLAAALVERCGAIRLRSDIERKRLHGLAASASSGSAPGAGLYAADASTRTYERLLALARGALEAGWPTIVDATFLRARERAAFRALARQLEVPFTLLHCEAPPVVLRERLRRRRGDASEADAAVLALQMQTQQPLSHAERASMLVAGPDADAGELGARWLAFKTR